jgi:hypothetical protein
MIGNGVGDLEGILIVAINFRTVEKQIAIGGLLL